MASRSNASRPDRAARQTEVARGLVEELARGLALDARVRLWDGTLLPLGPAANGPLIIRIAGPGVLGSLIRRPTLDNVIRHYALKMIDFEGGSLIDLGEQLNAKGARGRLRSISKAKVLRALSAFAFTPAETSRIEHAFAGENTGRDASKRDNTAFIQFHYDVGNAFYALFLDPQMQYSCAYYKDWDTSLEQAQRDKLEMICRKLRLKPGERFLDIGCGWGGLACHAARHHGVHAHGITLSKEQLAFAQEKVERLGLQDSVTLELRDYQSLDGSFDKIASIGMYEHIGLANIPGYMKTVRRVLSPDGLFLNHAISRRARRPVSPWNVWGQMRANRMRPEQKAMAKYIFPGGELDDIGHTVAAMELAGFEVHDVEAWRRHYARTTRLWCERLTARREAAIALVGEEKYRIWIAYLAGCSLAFARGTLRIYQTLASRSAKGASPLPPTRSDLYR